jgi:8-oxo-dGTP pyrophosphatase MutT (NUDIX family)
VSLGRQRDLPERIRERLRERTPRLQTEWAARPAAVLLPLYSQNLAWHLLFTRRTESVESHRGQVSFPGGQVEDGDLNVQSAALREAWEEIGLRPQDVQILGQLDPMLTVTQFMITPVVGLIPWPYELHIQPLEVARLFGVPLAWLRDPDNLATEYRKPMIPGPEIPVHYFKPYDGETIWGVTARITLDFLKLIQET